MNQQVGDINNSTVGNANINNSTVENANQYKENKTSTSQIRGSGKKCVIRRDKYLFICNVLLLVANISLLCAIYPRTGDYLEFDYIGAVIGVLSFLVTILLGWNIYSALDIKKEVFGFKKDVSKHIDEIERKCGDLDVVLNEVDNLRIKTEEYNMGSIAFVQGVVMMKDKGDNRYDIMYGLFISSMLHFLRCDNQIADHLDRCMDNMEQCLNFMKQKTYDERKINEAFSEILRSSSSEFSDERKRRFYSLDAKRRQIVNKDVVPLEK